MSRSFGKAVESNGRLGLRSFYPCCDVRTAQYIRCITSTPSSFGIDAHDFKFGLGPAWVHDVSSLFTDSMALRAIAVDTPISFARARTSAEEACS